MKICVIVPMHNEEKIGRLSIATILSYAVKLPPAVTVIAINDGSQDKTADILKGLRKEYSADRFKFISHERNRGYGAALKTGAQFAIENGYDYVLFMDSDLTNHPKYLKDFYVLMREGWDYIKATRYAKGGRVEGVPRMNRLISSVGNKVAKILSGLPITDFTNGFRAVKVDLLKKMNLKENGFVIIMEELCEAKTLTASFCELPYTLTTRKHGSTHFSYRPKTCSRYLYYAIKSFFKRAPKPISIGEAHANK